MRKDFVCSKAAIARESNSVAAFQAKLKTITAGADARTAQAALIGRAAVGERLQAEEFRSIADALQAQASQGSLFFGPELVTLLETVARDPQLAGDVTLLWTKIRPQVKLPNDSDAFNLDASNGLGMTITADSTMDRRLANVLAGRSAGTTSSSTPLKHWLSIQESSVDVNRTQKDNDLWSAGSDGQVTAHPNYLPSYLILRYPIEGDFQIQLRVNQTNERKFGIGFGGLTLAPTSSSRMVRYFGSGGRPLYNAAAVELGYSKTFPLSIVRSRGVVELESPAGKSRSDAASGSPFFYLFSYGDGAAEFDQWRFSGDLKTLPEANLIDSQLRLWTQTSGRIALPKLSVEKSAKSEIEDVGGVPPDAICEVTEGVLTIRRGESDSTNDVSISYLRPPVEGETLEFEAYVDESGRTAAPVIGRMAMVVDKERLRLHWIPSPEDRRWFTIDESNRVDLTPAEVREPIQLKLDAWNRWQIRMERAEIVVRVNDRESARIKRTSDLGSAFGFLLSPETPQVQIRGVLLRGDWPEKISVSDLFLPSDVP
ncbi:MAG: DUF1583 domain-containing protein [Pirellulales bacterium]